MVPLAVSSMFFHEYTTPEIFRFVSRAGLDGLEYWLETPHFWLRGLIGGMLSAVSYGIALWAMTLAPIAIVASLRDIGRPIDMVDIFRNSSVALSLVEEALTLDPLPKVIWMQLGVRNDEVIRLQRKLGTVNGKEFLPRLGPAQLDLFAADQVGYQPHLTRRAGDISLDSACFECHVLPVWISVMLFPPSFPDVHGRCASVKIRPACDRSCFPGHTPG